MTIEEREAIVRALDAIAATAAAIEVEMACLERHLGDLRTEIKAASR